MPALMFAPRSALSILRLMAALLFIFAACPVVTVHAANVPPLRVVPVGNVAALNDAVAQARAGDEIVLMPGTYDIGRTRLAASGTREHPILLRAEQMGTARILSTAAIVFSVTGAHWTIDGLDIQGVCEPQENCDHAFQVVGNADGLIIRNNRMRDFNATIKANGLKQPAGMENVRDLFPDDVLIEGNYIYNTTPRATAKPVALLDVVGGQNWVVRRNFVADFEKEKGNKVAYGMFLKGNSRNGVFERNMVICEWKHSGGPRIGRSLGGGGTGKGFCEGQDCSAEHTNGMIRNNILLNCTHDVGLYLNKARDTKVYNNSIINTGGIDIRFSTSNADVRNNIVSGFLRDRDDATYTESNNLVHRHSGTLMDLFADVQKGNFRLKKEGEIMGQGRRAPGLTDDFCGTPRRLPAVDLGAIEYGSARCGSAAMLRGAENFGN